MKRNYDSTVARIAGNIAAGLVTCDSEKAWTVQMHAEYCVALARAIVAETERTEPVGAEARPDKE